MVSDLPQVESLQCKSCQWGKHVRVCFFNRINNRVMAHFDVVHSNVWGPSRVPSTLGYKYYVTFTDDFSRCTWVFLMRNRSKLFNIFKIFCSEIMT